MYARRSLLSSFLFVSPHHLNLYFRLDMAPPRTFHRTCLSSQSMVSLIAHRSSLAYNVRFLITTQEMPLVKAGSLRHHAAVHAVRLEAAAPSALQCNPRPLLQVRLRGIGSSRRSANHEPPAQRPAHAHPILLFGLLVGRLCPELFDLLFERSNLSLSASLIFLKIQHNQGSWLRKTRTLALTSRCCCST